MLSLWPVVLSIFSCAYWPFCVSSLLTCLSIRPHFCWVVCIFIMDQYSFLFAWWPLSVLGLSCGTQMINPCCNVQDL